ncbi:helix-turn-helix domain-containing protein [Adhaeribacter pallidiroseus]|uniref:Helix-turn-helix domain-containing protein n=1 Tax=Adhaeribacter pallidiroseus TaxID=2072847 RepID=A0A369QJP6_9BACT|nr:helix-turn-helix domain-containing protein [Adhaeribacter pallidiroseus]RDC64612.1 hypothetical protein AHMF7616_03228 [Adhaeribacter pallidiroseus]
MNDILLTPIRLNELETLITNSVRKALLESHNNTQKELETLDENLTIQQAATFLNLAVPTIYGMVSRQEIPFSKPGKSKRLYFSKKDLTDFIKSGRRKTIAEIGQEADRYVASKTQKKR